MKKMITTICILLCVMAMVACGSPSDTYEPVPPVNPVNVTMEIVIGLEDATEDGFEGMKETALCVEEGSNLQEATQLFCLANDITCSIDEKNNYVTEIGGLTEKDYMETTGWVFKVNGEVPSVPAVDVVVAENDKITWEFVDFNTFSW